MQIIMYIVQIGAIRENKIISLCEDPLHIEDKNPVGQLRPCLN